MFDDFFWVPYSGTKPEFTFGIFWASYLWYPVIYMVYLQSPRDGITESEGETTRTWGFAPSETTTESDPGVLFAKKMGDLTFKNQRNGCKWIQMDQSQAQNWSLWGSCSSNSDTCFGSLLNLVFYSADIWFGGGVVMQRICNKINKDGLFFLFG